MAFGPSRLLSTILPTVSVEKSLEMPPGHAITYLKRGQILALQTERISFRRIADMVNRSLGAVQGVILQGFKHKELRKWKGNQNFSQTQKRAMVRMALQGEESARQIWAQLKLTIGNRRVPQFLSSVPYLKYKK